MEIIETPGRCWINICFLVLPEVCFFKSGLHHWLNYSSRYPSGGSKRGNPTTTTSMVTARRKGDHRHYFEEKRKDGKIKQNSFQPGRPKLAWQR